MRKRTIQRWEMNTWQPDLSRMQTYEEIANEAKLLNPAQRRQQVIEILAQTLVDHLLTLECDKIKNQNKT